MTADERLTAIRQKIEWAKHHIANLESIIKTFRSGEPYKLVTEQNPQTKRYETRVAKIAPLPPDIPHIVGDCFHNLRGALDHLVYQLVVAYQRGVVPSRAVVKQLMFPIYDTVEIYESNVLRKVQGANPKAIEMIHALKPYRGGNDDLWGLSEANNIDKHRLILTVGHFSPALIVDFGMMSFGKSLKLRLNSRDTTAEVGTVLFESPDLKHNKHVQIGFGIALGEPEVFKSKSLVPLLHQLTNLVDAIIVEFRPHLEAPSPTV